MSQCGETAFQFPSAELQAMTELHCQRQTDQRCRGPKTPEMTEKE